MLDDFWPPNSFQTAGDGEAGHTHRLRVLSKLPRFFSDQWSTNKLLLAMCVLTRIARSALPLQLLFVTKHLIDIAGKYLHTDHITCSAAFSTVCIELIPWRVLLSMFLNVTLTLICGRLSSYLEHRLSSEFQHKISVKLMRHAADLSLEAMESPSVKDKLERARRQIGSRISLLSLALNEFQSFATLIAYSVGVVVIAPLVIIFIAIAWIPIILSDISSNERNYQRERGRSSFRRYLDYVRAISSSSSAKEVRGFRLGGYFIDRYTKISEHIQAEDHEEDFNRLAQASAFSVLGGLSILVACAFSLTYAYSGAVSIGGFAFLTMGILRMIRLMQASANGLSHLASQALFLDDLYDFFDISTPQRLVERELAFPRPMQIGMKISSISYRYDNARAYTLKDVSMSLESGKVTALVGPNGAGKSTLVKILTGMYEPSEGVISIDGVPLQSYSPIEISKNIVALFQDFVRYPLRMFDNVGFGNIELGLDEERAMAAAVKATAAPLVGRMPMGGRQIVGTLFDGGIDLSGGEWQKLAIARLHISDAQIYIFDEPTASLDAKSESQALECIRHIAVEKGASVLLISHRMSSVSVADKIYVIREGTIVEEGTHDQLLSGNGLYAQYRDTQNLRK